MKVSFEPLLWEDYPSINTPVNAENLNRLEAGVAGLYEDMVEINAKLNGAFSEYVTDWLDEHVTPTGSAVIVDNTLSITGAAADAKKTGDEISSLKEELGDMSTATASDVGKALKAKTVSGGKVTAWEFGDAGGTDVEVIDGTLYIDGVAQSIEGVDGVGISNISKTGSSGLVDTYTITMTDGTTYTFTVTNGDASDAKIQQFIDDWLDDHPEATTTVDNRIYKKILNSVSDMIADNTLSVGDKVKTQGYYTNKAGGGDYVIDSSPTFASNEYISIPLNNGLYANLIINANTVYAEQIGCKVEDTLFDNADPVNKISNNNDFYDTTIVFTTGKYYFQHSLRNTRGCVLLGDDLNWNNFGVNNPKLIFESIDYNNSAIYCQSGCMIKNLFLVGEFETVTEDRTKIGTVTDAENTTWLTAVASVADTTGIEMYSNFNSLVENCVIQGFGTGVHFGSACYCVNTAFYKCRRGIVSSNDNKFINLRFESCISGIYCLNLNTINSIRADGVLNYLVLLAGHSNVVSDIAGDYVGQNVIRVENINNEIENITGRCGVNFYGMTSTLSETNNLRNAMISMNGASGTSASNIDSKLHVLDRGEQTVNKIFAVISSQNCYLQGVSREIFTSDPTVYVFVGSGTSSFKLMLATNEYNYIDGAWYKVPVNFNVNNDRLTLTVGTGEIYNQKYLRIGMLNGYVALNTNVSINDAILTLNYKPLIKVTILFKVGTNIERGYIDTSGKVYSETTAFSSGQYLFFDCSYITV